ncbi:MAG: hypothetical protein ACLRFJ_01110 [Alphaproteobacteria bacterium]
MKRYILLVCGFLIALSCPAFAEGESGTADPDPAKTLATQAYVDSMYTVVNSGLTSVNTALDGKADKGSIVNADVAANAGINLSKTDLAAMPQVGTSISGTVADGVYVLTATVTGGTISGYKWEQISRIED